jgi:hypothetical protein
MSQNRQVPFLEMFEEEEAELAQQLLALREEPGPALRQRVQAIPGQPRQARRRLGPHLALASLALVLAILLFTSPAAQAMLGQVEQVIGRIHLMIVEARPARVNPIAEESTPISLSQARAAVPFTVTMPAYLPPGLKPDPEIFVTELETPIIKLRWRDTEGGFVQLAVHEANQEKTRFQNLVGQESSEPILINGQEAVIIYGGWDETSQAWSHQERITTLIWEESGIQYNLLSFSTVVPQTDLVVMAESVR